MTKYSSWTLPILAILSILLARSGKNILDIPLEALGALCLIGAWSLTRQADRSDTSGIIVVCCVSALIMRYIAVNRADLGMLIAWIMSGFFSLVALLHLPGVLRKA